MTTAQNDESEDLGLEDELEEARISNEELQRLPGRKTNLTCPDCKAALMELRASRFGLFYGCQRYPDCRGTHGANLDGSPRGIPGNKAVREARVKVHLAFEELWRTRKGSEPYTKDALGEVYTWLAVSLGVNANQLWVGKLDEDGCYTLIERVQYLIHGPKTRLQRILEKDIL